MTEPPGHRGHVGGKEDQEVRDEGRRDSGPRLEPLPRARPDGGARHVPGPGEHDQHHADREEVRALVEAQPRQSCEPVVRPQVAFLPQVERAVDGGQGERRPQ